MTKERVQRAAMMRMIPEDLCRIELLFLLRQVHQLSPFPFKRGSTLSFETCTEKFCYHNYGSELITKLTLLVASID